MIALETYERHGRPTCSECNDRLREQRGCKKPPHNYEAQMGFRYTAPSLVTDDKPLLLTECPVGMLHREMPYVYDAIRVQACAENGATDPLTLSPWAQSAISIVSSEKARLRELGKTNPVADSNAGLRARGG